MKKDKSKNIIQQNLWKHFWFGKCNNLIIQLWNDRKWQIEEIYNTFNESTHHCKNVNVTPRITYHLIRKPYDYWRGSRYSLFGSRIFLRALKFDTIEEPKMICLHLHIDIPNRWAWRSFQDQFSAYWSFNLILHYIEIVIHDTK